MGRGGEAERGWNEVSILRGEAACGSSWCVTNPPYPATAAAPALKRFTHWIFLMYGTSLVSSQPDTPQ